VVVNSRTHFVRSRATPEVPSLGADRQPGEAVAIDARQRHRHGDPRVAAETLLPNRVRQLSRTGTHQVRGRWRLKLTPTCTSERTRLTSWTQPELVLES
jgi:hypothetical protein